MDESTHVRVRIAVAVDAMGYWDAEGWNFPSCSSSDGMAAAFAKEEIGTDPRRIKVSFVEAWVPRLLAETAEAAETVEAEVVSQGDDARKLAGELAVALDNLRVSARNNCETNEGFDIIEDLACADAVLLRPEVATAVKHLEGEDA